ncbi:MAG: hypothetical protein IJE02_04220 [Clostridia bacterium]|nr:hypothetical protein [Clostridia bacterium]
MLKQELLNRNLPPLKSREEMVEIMQREVYGYLPKNDFEWSVANYKRRDGRLAKGNVIYSTVDFTLANDNGSHTFLIHQFLHTDGEKHPTFLHIAGRYPGNFVPEEEIVENGYNLIVFVYTEITSDDDDFTTGIAPLVFPNGRTNDTDCGKIGLWAFASMRVLDYALTLDCVDEKNIAIVGQSRLGKTALVTGMLDERFTFSLSNNAGCAGDTLSRGNSGLPDADGKFAVEKEFRGETVERITTVFPYWFCKNYLKYAKQNYGTDFDQHYLVASIAPRNVCVTSAELDYWADQKGEQLCCLAASEAWEKLGLVGLQECDHYLVPGEKLLNGNVGYSMTPTTHFLSRHAWINYMEFMRIHRHN